MRLVHLLAAILAISIAMFGVALHEYGDLPMSTGAGITLVVLLQAAALLISTFVGHRALKWMYENS